MALTDSDLKRIQSAGWNFPPDLWATLSDYEKSFAVLELEGIKSPNYYRERLTSLGFAHRGRVLDAACGMGQWANALAELGNQVDGVDLMECRIDVAKALAKAQGNACQFQAGSIEKLPFPNCSFDGIFCYGAFMFTDMPLTLSEFARVLKPGGRIYLNGNTWGWYAHLILDRGFKGRNYSLIYAAMRMIARTLVGRPSQIVITESWLRNELHKAGFSVLKLGAEGAVSLNAGYVNSPPPAYPSTFYGLRSIIELVAERTK
jgi:ubiquinone/menaquinone biosynthesis C-methylase UbiE